jgi:LPXTG-motif cell wall-anchored protein
MVVVPTDNEVVIEFEDTWAESSGQILTIVGGAALIIGGFVAWRRSRASGLSQSSESVGS